LREAPDRQGADGPHIKFSAFTADKACELFHRLRRARLLRSRCPFRRGTFIDTYDVVRNFRLHGLCSVLLATVQRAAASSSTVHWQAIAKGIATSVKSWCSRTVCKTARVASASANREWTIRGPNLPPGSKARVTGVDGTVLLVDRVAA